MSCYMGIDLGTSSVKAVILSETGEMLGCTQRGYEIETPQIGYAEQEPEIWWRQTAAVIREVLRISGCPKEEIAGIGFSGQMHGLVMTDKNGKVLAPAIIHLDQRSVEERNEILDKAGSLLSEELFNQPAPGMLICSLLWIKNHRCGIYEQIEKVMLPKDYIRYRMTGAVQCDVSDAAGTLAFSVKRGEWCWELIEKLGIKKEIWPETVSCTEVIGTVSAEASDVTGLLKGTKVVAGGGDAAMQLVGNGIISEGTLCCNIGTASQLCAVLSAPAYDPQMRTQIWCHAVPGRWYMQGGTLNGGSTLSWLRKKVLKKEESFEYLDHTASKVMAGSEGLLFLPYLSGERTPFQEPYGKGIFYGLTMKHEQEHLIRAVMEGVVYNLKECLKIMDELKLPRERIIAAGGGARGNTWKQIQADVFDMPVYATETKEEACTGAVIMAAVGCGAFSSVQEACGKLIAVSKEPVLPIPANVEIYKERQEKFLKLYESVRGMFEP